MTKLHPSLAAAQKLMDEKSGDYGQHDPARIEYFPYGDYSYLHMLHTKLERMKSVHRKITNGESTNFESLEDSCIDLINYAAFYHAYLLELKE